MPDGSDAAASSDNDSEDDLDREFAADEAKDLALLKAARDRTVRAAQRAASTAKLALAARVDAATTTGTTRDRGCIACHNCWRDRRCGGCSRRGTAAVHFDGSQNAQSGRAGAGQRGCPATTAVGPGARRRRRRRRRRQAKAAAAADVGDDDDGDNPYTSDGMPSRTSTAAAGTAAAEANTTTKATALRTRLAAADAPAVTVTAPAAGAGAGAGVRVGAGSAAGAVGVSVATSPTAPAPTASPAGAAGAAGATPTATAVAAAAAVTIPASKFLDVRALEARINPRSIVALRARLHAVAQALFL